MNAKTAVTDPVRQEFMDMYEDYLPEMREDAQIKDFLDAYSVTYEELDQMILSLLEDKSNYGNPERESLDDDLNTTIPIRGEGWTGITPPNLPKGEVKGWYTLQGVKIVKPGRKGIYIHKDESGTQLIHIK